MLNSIVMLAPLPAIQKRTRLVKMVKILEEKGISVEFLGWERNDSESKDIGWVGRHVSERIILRGGGYASRSARMMYPLWMLAVFVSVLRLGRRKTLLCLGWETAFPARIAAFFTGSSVVFDDADRFSMILNLPGVAGKLLASLERWLSYNCDLHIIPGCSRYEWKHDKMIVLRNAPLRSDFECAKSLPKRRVSSGLILYANGWIGETRGAPIFLDFLNQAEMRGLNISLLIAGQANGPSSDELLSHPSVHYLGEVSQLESLSWYKAVDLLLTFYDPSVQINKNAESNKWGDAVYFGAPFIVNSEVETAIDFVNAGAAWSVPYHDVARLLSVVEEVYSDRLLLSRASDACSRFKANYPVFEDGFGVVLAKLSS